MNFFINNDNYIAKGKYSEINAFITPQWGGIIIYNLKKNDSSEFHFTVPLLYPIMKIFLTQFRQLLGISPFDSKKMIPSKENGISEWEKDILIRRYLYYNLNSTISTLYSLSKLVQNLPNMVVLDNIAELIENSLSSLIKVYNLCKIFYIYFLRLFHIFQMVPITLLLKKVVMLLKIVKKHFLILICYLYYIFQMNINMPFMHCHLHLSYFN